MQTPAGVSAVLSSGERRWTGQPGKLSLALILEQSHEFELLNRLPTSQVTADLEEYGKAFKLNWLKIDPESSFVASTSSLLFGNSMLWMSLMILHIWGESNKAGRLPCDPWSRVLSADYNLEDCRGSLAAKAGNNEGPTCPGGQQDGHECALEAKKANGSAECTKTSMISRLWEVILYSAPIRPHLD